MPYPMPGRQSKIPLMRRGARSQALILLLTLLGGAFGLPLLDALAFHSTAQATEAAAPDQLGAGHSTGVAHALGCAVWTSAASGTGLPGALHARTLLGRGSTDCGHRPPSLLHTQTDLSLVRSRAPPRV